MTDHPIALHLRAALGNDVAVTLDDADAPRSVTLYRPDELTADFVESAFRTIAEDEPESLRGIEEVHVTFETPLGLSRRRIDLPADPS